MKETWKYLMENRRRILPIVLVILLAAAVLLINQANKLSQDLRTKAAADNGQLTLNAIVPPSLLPGQTVDVSVSLVNGGQAVVGADILVQFDKSKLTLLDITAGTSNVFKTFAPVDSNGNFDQNRVVDSANNATTGGVVEFGIVSFDWTANSLTSPTSANTTMSPVATMRFQVKTAAPSGSTVISIKNDGINATTDSNIVVIPTGGQPEDILQAPPYSSDRITLNIGGAASPVPTVSPSAMPSVVASVLPSVSPTTQCNTCYNFDNSTDGKIGILDILYVANIYGAKNGDSKYNVLADIYCPADAIDGEINLLDILTVANRYNQNSCQP